jgi:hypothetical protein
VVTTPTLTLARASRLVDAALYLAKQRGRNRAIGITALQASSDDAVNRIERDLAAATQREEVVLTSLLGPSRPDIAAALTTQATPTSQPAHKAHAPDAAAAMARVQAAAEAPA